MDWVILITALEIIAVATRSIENSPCNRARKSNLSLNQPKSTNHSSVDIEHTNVHDGNCTNEVSNETPEDQKQELTEKSINNIDNDDALPEYDDDTSYGVNNKKITHKYDTETTKREKSVKVAKAFSQRRIIKESNTRNGSGYNSTDDIRRAVRRSNSERSKNHPKTDDSKIYVFKDNLHPVYQIKRVDRNDLRSIKFNKTPKIAILRRKTNNKQVSNKINEEISSQNKININKNVTDVRKNLLDHLLEYFLRIMQEDKNKKVENEDDENIEDENKLGNDYDTRILEDGNIDASLNSNSASDVSLQSNSSIDESINNATNISIYENDENLEENKYKHQDENQNDQNDVIQVANEETVINNLSVRNNDSTTESYTDILGINNTDAEIVVNVIDTTNVPNSFDDISVLDDMSPYKTNNAAVNNTKENNEFDIDLNNKKHINILLENVDYTNGTTIDIDIPLNMTEAPIIINTHSEKNINEISGLKETRTTFTSDDFTDIADEVYNTEVKGTNVEREDNLVTKENINEISDLKETRTTFTSDNFTDTADEVYNAEVKRTDVEHEDNLVKKETTAQHRTASSDDGEEDHIQEQTRRILLGILNKNKKYEKDGNEIEVPGNCDKRLKMHIDINVF